MKAPTKEDFYDYEKFVEKFKPKKTTDDCYTPPAIYEVVAEYVSKEYGLNRKDFVRPFYPGGDYENFDYKENDVVVDNPPFSIFARIIDFYVGRRIKFFLFCPTLTSTNRFRKYINDISIIMTGATITYENGAKVNTSFITNLDDCTARTDPAFLEALEDANIKTTTTLPQFRYPPNVISGASMGKIKNVPFEIPRGSAVWIGKLDSQIEQNGGAYSAGIYGGGLLLSEKAAAERAIAEKAAAERVAEKEAIVWELSEREKEIIRKLSEKDDEIWARKR